MPNDRSEHALGNCQWTVLSGYNSTTVTLRQRDAFVFSTSASIQ